MAAIVVCAIPDLPPPSPASLDNIGTSEGGGRRGEGILCVVWPALPLAAAHLWQVCVGENRSGEWSGDGNSGVRCLTMLVPFTDPGMAGGGGRRQQSAASLWGWRGERDWGRGCSADGKCIDLQALTALVPLTDTGMPGGGGGPRAAGAASDRASRSITSVAGLWGRKDWSWGRSGDGKWTDLQPLTALTPLDNTGVLLGG